MVWIRRSLVSLVVMGFALLPPGCSFDAGGLGVSLGLSSEPPPDACVGEPYYHRFRAEGGKEPYTWKLRTSSEALPTGLELDGPTGILAGTPTAKVERRLRVEVTDAKSENSIAEFTLKTNDLAITTSEIPWVCSSSPFDFELRACGGKAPLTWSVTAGTLPTGVQLTTDGHLKGSFTAAAAVELTIQVEDSQGKKASRAFKLADRSGPTVVSPHRFPDGSVGQAYGPFSFAGCGGKQPYQWTLAAGAVAPPNVTLGSSGSLSGTPTKAGEYGFDVQLTDASAPALTASHHALLRVVSTPLDIATTSPLPSALDCQQYQKTLVAQGGTGTYSWSTVAPSQPPEGLSLGSNGVLSGQASKPAPTPYTFTAQVNDGLTSASRALELTVNEDATVSPALTVTEVRHSINFNFNEISLTALPNLKIDFRVAATGLAQVPKKAELQIVGGDCSAILSPKFLAPSDVNGDGLPEHVAVYNASLVKGLLAIAGKKAGDRVRLRFRVDVQMDQKVTSYVQLHQIVVVP